jgi:hypothetical protein
LWGDQHATLSPRRAGRLPRPACAPAGACSLPVAPGRTWVSRSSGGAAPTGTGAPGPGRLRAPPGFNGTGAHRQGSMTRGRGRHQASMKFPWEVGSPVRSQVLRTRQWPCGRQDDLECWQLPCALSSLHPGRDSHPHTTPGSPAWQPPSSMRPSCRWGLRGGQGALNPDPAGALPPLNINLDGTWPCPALSAASLSPPPTPPPHPASTHPERKRVHIFNPQPPWAHTLNPRAPRAHALNTEAPRARTLDPELPAGALPKPRAPAGTHPGGTARRAPAACARCSPPCPAAPTSCWPPPCAARRAAKA